MKLHLPKLLLTAVMAACSVAWGANERLYITDSTDTESFDFAGDGNQIIFDKVDADGYITNGTDIALDNATVWIGTGNANGPVDAAGKHAIMELTGTISGSGTIKFNECQANAIYRLTNGLGENETGFSGTLQLDRGYGDAGDTQLSLAGVGTRYASAVVKFTQAGDRILSIEGDTTLAGLTTDGSTARVTSNSANNTLTLNVTSSNALTYAGSIGIGSYYSSTDITDTTAKTSTALNLTKTGSGTQIISGAANLRNATVEAGTLNLNGATTLSGTVTANGGTLNLNGVLTINAGSTVSISGTTTTNIDKVISNAGSLSLGNVKFNLDNATSEVIGSLDDTVTGTQSFSEKYTFITGSGTVTKVGDFTFSKNGATYAGTLADDNKSVQTSANRYNIAVGGTADASTALQATVDNAAVSRVNVLGTMTGVYDGAWASEDSAVLVTGNGTVQVTGHLEDHNAKFAGFTGTILVDGNDPNTANGDEPNGGRIHLGTAVDAFSNSTIVLTGAVINGTTPARGYITGWRSNDNIQTFKQNIVLKGGAIKAENNSRWKSVTVDNADGATDTVSYYVAVGSGTGLTEGALNLNGGTLKFLGSNSVRLGGNVKFDGGVLDLNNLTVESNTKIANLQIVRGSTGEIKNGTVYVDAFDMRGGNDKLYGGTLTLTDANVVHSGSLWSHNVNTQVLLEGNSSLTQGGAKISSTAEAGQASIVVGADLNQVNYINSNGVTISNATVTANNADMTISAKLKDSSVTNASSGSLTVADMTVTDASAKQSTLTGDMTVNKLTLASGLSETVAAVTTSGALTLGSITLDLTDYAAGNYTLVSATGNGSITWNADAENALSYTGTLGEGLETSVVLAADNKTLQLTISEMVTPSESLITATVVEKNEGGSFVYGLEGTTLTLTVKSDYSLDSLAADGMVTVDLISEGMMNAILADLTNSETGEVTKLVTLKLTDGTTTIAADAFDKVVFVNEKGEGYYGEMVGGQLMYNVERIPEPTTATLSLLALMGLAARRRRQK